MRLARFANGTQVLVPLSSQSEPSCTAVVFGAAGSSFIGSISPALRTASPLTTPGSNLPFCSSLPKWSIGSAAETSDGMTGTGATV